jgi:hypothetical protein
MSVFYVGDHVDYLGDGLDGIPAAPGKIMLFASVTAAHVEWLDGPRTGQIDIVDCRDLEKSASVASMEAPRLTATSMRRVYNAEGEQGVLRYLSAIGHLDSWDKIADEALAYVLGRLKVDLSMELPYEQLACATSSRGR